jgi:hypothetical protein
MSTLSPRGDALVRAGRRAFQPTDADRVRLFGALSFRLGRLGCRPTWARRRPRLSRAELYGLPFRWLGSASASSAQPRSPRGGQTGRTR